MTIKHKDFLFEIYVGKKKHPSAAIPECSDTVFRFFVSRSLGAFNLRAFLYNDGSGETQSLNAKWITLKNGYDVYDAAFSSENDALFFLSVEFDTVSGKRAFIFPDGTDSLPVTVHKKDMKTPDWLKGGIIYQIFPDRFAKSERKKPFIRKDAVFKADWDKDIPDYPEKPGDAFDNNCFFGGSLYGVAEKLDYLQSLGVTTVYLNPIFEATSNHKYDTGNYFKVDDGFGGEKGLKTLITEIKKRGMHLILDGVFNHTGDDSIYFNRYGRYDSIGAYQSKDSEYKDWYFFKEFPDSYECWWGIDILPKLNPDCVACRDFLCNKGGVAEKYMKMGIGGWRLDVADELSNDFLDILRDTVKSASNGEGIIIGEVWENAADKIAYEKRRRYFRGKQLDSVMNYPVRNGILAFVKDGDSEMLYNVLTELYSSYPETVCHSRMNSLGTHDTERILSVLGDNKILELSNAELSTHKMTDRQRKKAIEKLKIASTLQYTVFGVPSIYYGDEAGLEGGHDPFCRQPYPWGSEETELVEHYRKLGRIRKENSAFGDGKFKIISRQSGFIAYERYNEEENILVVANVGRSSKGCELGGKVVDLLTGIVYDSRLSVAPNTAMILKPQE